MRSCCGKHLSCRCFRRRRWQRWYVFITNFFFKYSFLTPYAVAYEAGALAAFIDHNQAGYKVVSGISAGAINAVGFSQFRMGQEQAAKQYLIGRWRTIKRTDVYVNWIPGGIAEGFLAKSGLFNTEPLRKYLETNINKTAVWTTDRELHIGATNIHNSKYEGFTQTYDDIISATMASSAIPALFPTIKIGKSDFVDGGATYMTPVSSAIEKCHQIMPNASVHIDVILAFGDTEYPAALEYSTTPFIMLRTAFIVVNNIFIKDIQNAKIAYPNATIRVVKPLKWLGSIGKYLCIIDSIYSNTVNYQKKHKQVCCLTSAMKW